MNVGFKPTISSKTSWSRLLVTSNADNGTETIYLSVGQQSTGVVNSLGTIGGNVGTVLSLTLGSSASFGSFIAGRSAATTTPRRAANVVSTAGNATLSVVDADTANPGQLVNGAFALSQPLQVRANNAANPARRSRR